MIRKRSRFAATFLALALVILLAPLPADAGIISRGKQAGKAMFTNTGEVHGWAVTPSIVTAEGDFEALIVSVPGSDPTKPAYILRVQATDAARVGKDLQLGSFVMAKDFVIEYGSAGLPVLIVAARGEGGWKAKWEKESPTFAQWGYLIAARVTAHEPALYARFFGHRPGTMARIQGDVSAMYETAFGAPGSAGNEAEQCQQELEQARRVANTYAVALTRLRDSQQTLRESPAAEHHQEVMNALANAEAIFSAIGIDPN